MRIYEITRHLIDPNFPREFATTYRNGNYYEEFYIEAQSREKAVKIVKKIPLPCGLKIQAIHDWRGGPLREDGIIVEKEIKIINKKNGFSEDFFNDYGMDI